MKSNSDVCSEEYLLEVHHLFQVVAYSVPNHCRHKLQARKCQTFYRRCPSLREYQTDICLAIHFFHPQVGTRSISEGTGIAEDMQL